MPYLKYFFICLCCALIYSAKICAQDTLTHITDSTPTQIATTIDSSKIADTSAIKTDTMRLQKSITFLHAPLFINRQDNLFVKMDMDSTHPDARVQSIYFHFRASQKQLVEHIRLYSVAHVLSTSQRKFLGAYAPDQNGYLRMNIPTDDGDNHFELTMDLAVGTTLSDTLHVEIMRMVLQNGRVIHKPLCNTFATALVLRARGQNGVHTTRMPGIIRTPKGTLVASFAMRHTSAKDLQNDSDIGMRRSTDSGRTWSATQTIIDMKNWGGAPNDENGVDEPAILVDTATGRIWVAALWFHGSKGKVWDDSDTGLSPQQTAQVLLVKSEDEGVTWSAPINITTQIKNPHWQLCMVSPGTGICADGVLIFPAIYKRPKTTDEQEYDGILGIGSPDEFIAGATIIYSMDSGASWHIGTQARARTTQSAVVVLADGRLMLNMRDESTYNKKKHLRAVATSRDMGRSWILQTHADSVLTDPICMASLIRSQFKIADTTREVLFFSNPNSRTDERNNMTIRANLNEGRLWNMRNAYLVDEHVGYGYSSLVKIDESHVGILYEAKGDLYFQKVPVARIVHVVPH